MVAGTKRDKLVQWFLENEIEWEKGVISIVESDGAFSVLACKNLKKGKTVVRIPKTAILSNRSSGIANILTDEKIQGGCALAMAIMYEQSQGSESPWYGYLQSLPLREENLPIFWTKEEQSWLKGTEVDRTVRNDLHGLKQDYEAIVEPLLNKYPDIFHRVNFSFDLFCNVSSLISSRSFEVDAYHNMAMVPFADLFNHAGDGEHVHFETDYSVCRLCGELDGCQHAIMGGGDSEDEENHVNTMDMDEQDIDLASSCNSDEDELEVPEYEESDEEPEETELPDFEAMEKKGVDIWKEEEEKPRKDTCDMILDRSVSKGQEIFNTYGSYSNAALLCKYGFCLSDNKYDGVYVSADDVANTCLELCMEQVRKAMPQADKETWKQVAEDQMRERWVFVMELRPTLLSAIEEGEDSDGEGEGEGLEEEEENEDGDDVGDDDLSSVNGGSEPTKDEMSSAATLFDIHPNGPFEPAVPLLFYMMLLDEEAFESFCEDSSAVLSFVHERILTQTQVQALSAEQIHQDETVYTRCLDLCSQRRKDYGSLKWHTELDNDSDNKIHQLRQRYARDCRQSEWSVLDACEAYYSDLLESRAKKSHRPAKRFKQ